MVENAIDRHRGEKSFGHAKLGVRLLKETQLINELGAEERDLAKYRIQIVRLLPSDDYVLGGGFPDLLHCCVVAGLAERLDDRVENVRNVVHDLWSRHGTRGNPRIISHALDPRCGDELFVSFQIARQPATDAFKLGFGVLHS